MPKLYNLARMTTATTGTGTITLGAAVSGYLTFALAGVSDGDVVDYGIKDGANSEIGTGTYTASGTTLTRTVTKSTNSNSAISLSGSAEVFITPRAETLNDASLLTTGTVAQARLGSGSASSGSFLRGDQSWQGIPLDFRNILYANGGLEVWQRGAGGSASISVAASTTAYCADRWYLKTGANQAFTVSQQAGLTNQSRWAARVQRNSGQTGTGTVYFEYPLTVDECVALRGQNITLSFYVATGSNWSPTSGTITVNAYFGTGTEGKRNSSAYTGETNPLSTSFNVSSGSSAAQKTFTGGSTVATNVTQGCLQFSFAPTGTASTNDYFDIDDVQLEIGSFVTSFERISFAEALRECQRHYCKTFNYATAPAQNAGTAGSATGCASGAGAQTNGVGVDRRFPVSMRSAPTITLYNPSAANALIRQLAEAIDSQTPSSSASTEGVSITATTNVSTTLYGAVIVHVQADAGL